MAHKFGKVVSHANDHHDIVVLDDTGADQRLTVSSEDFPAAIIELLATYEITPMSMNLMVDSPETSSALMGNFFKSFKGLDVYYDSNQGQYGASAKNGDTGELEHEFGETLAQAVANLARAHGFKSRLPDDGGLSINQWFVDFAYGFQRISDELLQAELDSLYNPDKGAW